MPRYPPTMTTMATYALCQRGAPDPLDPNKYITWIGPQMVVPCYLMDETYIFFPVQSLEPPPELEFVRIDDWVGGCSVVDGKLDSSMFLE